MMKWFDIKNKKNGIGVINIFGYIMDKAWDETDVTPTLFKKELDGLKDSKEIELYINSGGGNVFVGITIYQMIKRLPQNVTAYIDGIAASIASVIIMAANKIVMPKNSMIMIHNPIGGVYGNANDMLKMAETLEKVKNSIIESYSRTGVDEKKLSDMMDEETWINAEEALELGFADEIEEEMKIAASLKDSKFIVNGIEHDITKYNRFPLKNTASGKNEVDLSVYRRILDNINNLIEER